MAYSAEISRSNPSCFLFLLDQSSSMQDGIPLSQEGGGTDGAPGGTGRSKAQAVSDIINKALQTLTIKCAKEEGIRSYFDVGVIGYGAQVGHVFGGALAGRELVSITEVGNSPARVEERKRKVDDGAGGILEQTVRFPVWFDPTASGGTPMNRALSLARSTLESWIGQHPNSFPPVVIHITDGESTDGDPTASADALKALATSDGNVLLFNAHFASAAVNPVEFPESESKLPTDRFAQLLFRISSPLTPFMRTCAQQDGIHVVKDRAAMCSTRTLCH